MTRILFYYCLDHHFTFHGKFVPKLIGIRSFHISFQNLIALLLSFLSKDIPNKLECDHQ